MNHAEKDNILVKGDFEPIVSEELWNTCNELRTKRAACLMDSSGRKHAYGKSFPQNKWTKILYCDCGAPMRCEGIDKKANGILNMRFVCSATKRISRKTEKRYGVPCPNPYASEWKLELMAREVFRTVWKDRRADVLKTVRAVDTYLGVNKTDTRNKAHEANYLCYRKLKSRRADKSKPIPAWQRVDCKVAYVAQWKLELMAKEVFQQVWKDHKQEILSYYREENEKNAISPDHSKEIEKKKRLIEKTQNDRQEVDSRYRQNLIPLSTYQNICDRYDACIRHAQEDLAALESKPRFYDLKKIEESLNWKELFPDGYVSREFLDRFVSRIFAVDAQRFVWELNLSQKKLFDRMRRNRHLSVPLRYDTSVGGKTGSR